MQRLRYLFVAALSLAAAIALPLRPAQSESTAPQPAHTIPSDVETADPQGDETPDPSELTENKALAPADQKNVLRAKEWFTRIQNGDIDRTQLTSEFSEALTQSVVDQTSARLKPFGDPSSFDAGGKYVSNGTSAYVFRVSWPEGGVLYQFAIDDATGKISGIFTRPAPPTRLTR